METSISNIADIGNITSPIANPYKRGTNLEKGKFQVVLKPHKILGKRNGEELYINKKSTLEKILKREMCRMGVIDLDKVDYTRVDIALDRPEKYEDCIKETAYLFHLLSLEFKNRELWYTTSLRDGKVNTFVAKGRSFELSFYDKEKESNGAFPYKTRYEFRLKRLKGTDLDKSINKIIDKLKNLNERINSVELEAINLLTKKFEEEIEKNIVVNLTEFVRKYELFIYNGNILKGLYKSSGLKGSYNKWLEKYRTKRELKLISDTAIKKQINECIRALKLYKNDGVGNRILTPFFFEKNLLIVGKMIKNKIRFKVVLRSLFQWLN